MKHLQNDHRMMLQVVSSAIWNAPPPVTLINLMHRTNRASTLTVKTKEKMLRLFQVCKQCAACTTLEGWELLSRPSMPLMPYPLSLGDFVAGLPLGFFCSRRDWRVFFVLFPLFFGGGGLKRSLGEAEHGAEGGGGGAFRQKAS